MQALVGGLVVECNIRTCEV